MKLKAKPPFEIPKKYLSDIHFSGLQGRLLHLPQPAKVKKPKTFVVFAGQHASLERMYSIAQLLNEFGEVYMPDLPGYGGMTSFYKIGKKPTYDNYADFVYTFLKTQKLNKDLWFFGNSFGSAVMTRLFQKHPESQKWTKQPIAFVGYGAGSNFAVSFWYRLWIGLMVNTVSTRLGAFLFEKLIFNRFSIHIMLYFFSRAKAKMQSDSDNLKKSMIMMEKYLWSVNDHRTHAACVKMMFKDDLRHYPGGKIKLTLHNIATENDQYFDNKRVKKTFEDLYEKYETSPLTLQVHSPSMIADKDTVRAMLSDEALKLLAS